MNIPPLLTFDPALLDMDNLSVEKWYALLYNRTVQQQDTFVGDFKKKVVELIKTCTNKPNTTTESLKQDITNTINESQFEFEHQKFIDGIVGNAYEYLCQFIIKNSIDNIRRTQCALNCFSLSNSLNYGTIKPCYNENILLQDSSKLPQIQCSSESCNNTSDTNKTVQSYFNDSENDPNSMLMAVRENIKNTMENKIETTSFHSYEEETLEINNLSIESPNDESFNNFHTNNDENTSLTIDDDDKTTQAIISLAMKIQQANFHDVDYFEANELNNSNICTNNEDLTTKCLLEQNGDQILDPLKLEEEYKINNSLKLLESLVNIEHDKLEVQKSLVINEPQSNIENSEKNLFKSPTKTKIGKKKSRKLQENINKEDEEEWLPSNEKQKNHYSKKTKTDKRKSHKSRATKRNKKMETQNTLNNLFTSSSSSFVEIKNDQSTSVTMPETIVSTVKNTKSLDTSCRIGTLLAYQNEKGCLPTSEFKQLPDDVESIPHNEKKKRLTTVNNSDVLSNKTSPIASTSGYNEKDVDSLKSKLSTPSGSSMKTLDYKKIYEKDRKSLFNPDVIIIKNVPSKSPKELINDPQIKKEYNSIQKKEDSEKMPKPKICMVENNKTSNKRKNLTKKNVDKVEITDNSSKLKNDSKSKTNQASISKNKYKRIKVTKSDDTANTNTVSNKNNKSNTRDVLENKVSSKIDTLDSQELNTKNILKSNMLDEGTSEHQQLNGTNLLENKESDENTSVNETMPEWIRLLWATHSIKPCYVVIDPNVTY